MTLPRAIASDWTALQRAQDGSIMPMIAMSLTAIIALGGAALALAMDGRAANNIQSTADFAALSGASAFVAASSPRLEDRVADAQSAVAASVTANADYIVRNMDVSSIVEDPYGQHARIEVKLGFKPSNPAARLAGRNAGIEIERQAIASATWGFPLCILGLTSSGTGFGLQHQADLSAKNCVVWTNATSGTSMQMSGGTAEAKHFCAAGRASTSGAKVTPAPYEDCDPIPDPLASWTAPPPGPLRSSGDLAPAVTGKALAAISLVLSGFIDRAILEGTFQTTSEAVAIIEQELMASPAKLLDSNRRFTVGPAKGLTLYELLQIAGSLDNVSKALYALDTYAALPTHVLSPGTYNGLDIAKGHVKLEPGIYHIVDGPLVVRRRATLSGEGVTIILVGDRATVSVLDEARLTVVAPETGQTAGFALAEDRRQALKKPAQLRSRLTGSGKVSLIGTVYLPRQKFSITGKGAADQSSPLLQIVADNLDMEGHGALKIDFDPSVTRVPVTIKAAREARLEQ